MWSWRRPYHHHRNRAISSSTSSIAALYIAKHACEFSGRRRTHGHVPSWGRSLGREASSGGNLAKDGSRARERRVGMVEVSEAEARRGSLRSFLGEARRVLGSGGGGCAPEGVRLVVGNESADLDSILCAVAYAYLRTYSPVWKGKEQHFYIPLANLPREDLTLRTELLPVLASADLKLEDLLTLSDLPKEEELEEWSSGPGSGGDVSVVLVDHNALTGVLRKHLKEKVVGVIDHHEDEGVIPKETGAEPRIIKKSGSCTSLVVNYCREAWDALSEDRPTGSDGEMREWDRQLALMALAPVLVDTNCLRDEHKVTEDDTKAVEYLESKLSSSSSKPSALATSHTETKESYDRTAYFDQISTAKADIGSLTLEDILRKDYKSWTENGLEIGIASCVREIEFLVTKAGGNAAFARTLEEFAKQRNLSIMSVMTAGDFGDGGTFMRELLVYGVDEKGREAAERFRKEKGEVLKLETWRGGELDGDVGREGEGEELGRWCAVQGELTASRKQVAPLLRGVARAGGQQKG